MLNQDKYKTAEERVKAFGEFCKNEFCNQCNHLDCKLHKQGSAILHCYDWWLALEAEEEKPENCPFCGGEMVGRFNSLGPSIWSGKCSCGYKTKDFFTKDDAIDAHNRVARAVRAAREGEVK